MKPYVKPALFYESFELSQHIAACGWTFKNSTTAEQCAATNDAYNGFSPTVFNSNGVCDVDPENYGDICGTNGGEEQNIFGS